MYTPFQGEGGKSSRVQTFFDAQDKRCLMRRIYESDALHREDDEPFTPNERRKSELEEAMSSTGGFGLSRYLLPQWLGRRFLSISVSTPRSTFPVDATVPFKVVMKNPMPFPIRLSTRSPVLWTWNIDGLTNGSQVNLHDPPDERRTFEFSRGEAKQFTRRWEQLFQVSETTWEPAGPGTYEIGAGINVESPAECGLYDETTIQIIPE